MVVWTDGIEVGTSGACSLGLFEGFEVVGDELGAFDGLGVGLGGEREVVDEG